ncbi:MAG: DUF115 domain-containing protein [Treponemataceae bacterium]|nr:DUF115 domain-containing protein [Treponemataceae bacterium]
MNSTLSDQNVPLFGSSLLDPDLYAKNALLFSERFPALSEMCGIRGDKAPDYRLIQEQIKFEKARNGMISARYDGALLHSAYNPAAEAQKQISGLFARDENKTKDILVFFGFGLGYAVNEAARVFPEKTIVVVEPDLIRLQTAFCALDWAPVFALKKIIFFVGTKHQNIIGILEKQGLKNCLVIRNPAFEKHNQKYFADLQTLINRNIQKAATNAKTLKTFSKLWFSNSVKNMMRLSECRGISCFKGIFAESDIPALVVAAGPSLDRILPQLSRLKEHCVLICVDTALRALVNAGIEPDFVLVVDPQYWNARHFDRLKTPGSFLVTEIASYPSVFRFECKEILLGSSMFPLGKYLEQKTEIKGELAAGGSVSSTAWDFARYLGCRKIYLAGLDLSFPKGRTHTRGSTFEEKAFTGSLRLNPAETWLTSALYGAQPVTKSDYNGNPLLSDNRMALYAWWFESNCSRFAENGGQTFTLTPESLAIPGIKVADAEELLSASPCRAYADKLICGAGSKPDEKQKAEEKKKLMNVIEELLTELREMRSRTKNVLELCRSTLDSEHKTEALLLVTLKKISEYEAGLTKSTAADLASLLFPSEEEIDSLSKKLICAEVPEQLSGYCDNISRSSAVYECVLEALDKYINKIEENSVKSGK